MTQSSRSSSSISPTNSRSSLKRYNISPRKEIRIAKRRAEWEKVRRLEELHNKRKEERIAEWNMERRKKEEEDRRRRNRSSRENRRDISPSAADPSNESTRPRAHPPDNRRRRSDSPVASTSAGVPRRERDNSSLAENLRNALRDALSGSSQPTSRNDQLQQTLNSQTNSRSLGRLIEVRPGIDRTKEKNEVLFRIVFEELLNQLQEEDRRNDEPDRRSPSPQGRRSQLSTSGTSRPLLVRGSTRSSRERSPKRDSSRDRPGHRSRSRSRHRHPDSRDSNYRRSNQEGRSQRSPIRHSSSRHHEQQRAHRRPRSSQERAQRHDSGHSMEHSAPPPHQHSSAAVPYWSGYDYPPSQNLDEWQPQPPRQLHPPYPPIRPPPVPMIYYNVYGRPMEYLTPRYMVAPPMEVPELRQRPPFPIWRGPRPQFPNIGRPPRYHGNRFRHPRPNSYRGNQQAPDTTQQTDANPTTARPRREEGDDTGNKETSKK